ncbi:MAG: hypothetical protein EPO07_01490, partial [Verrucomicrobia bacterium]
MLKNSLYAVVLAAVTTSCCTKTNSCCDSTSSAGDSTSKMKTVADIQKSGLKFKNVLSLPQFETTPEAIKATSAKIMADGNAALDVIGRLDPKAVTFANTLGAMDSMNFQATAAANRLGLIKETSTSAA